MAVLAVLALTSAAQGQAAAGSLVGQIYDRAGPVPGAVVVVEGETGRHQVAAGQDGSYSLHRLAPGRHRIEVSHDGHRPSVGTVDLAPSGAASRLDVELRRLDEETPRGVESLPEVTVRRWLETGNDLLAQGRSSEARGEFQKATRYLDGAALADTHRAIARTRWLEQDVEGTIEELERALSVELAAEVVDSVEDSDSFQLLRTLLEQLGRSEELEGRIASARTRQTPAAPDSAAATRAPPPRVAPRPLRDAGSGHQTIVLPNDAEVPRVKELRDRLGPLHFAEGPLPADSTIVWPEESYSLYVPPGGPIPRSTAKSNSPAALQPEESATGPESWGLIVWLSPVALGSPPVSPEFADLLATRRLLWVGAHDAGNQRASWQRIALALAAARELPRHLAIDRTRIYVAGYSGGGRLASAMAWTWPEVFAGGIFWFGTDFYEPVAVPYKPGARWAPRFQSPSREQRKLLGDRRFAYVTGDLDFNRSETRAVWRAARERGFGQQEYLMIPGANHYVGLDPEWFAKALGVVEGR